MRYHPNTSEDVRQMLEFHEERKADLTVAAILSMLITPIAMNREVPSRLKA